jgi:hypothetical protein
VADDLGNQILRILGTFQRDSKVSEAVTAIGDLIEQARTEARDQAAADVEAHAKELMDAAIKQVTKDDTDGYSATLRAATVGYVAQYLRGEAGR